MNIALKDSDKNPFVTLDICARRIAVFRENCCCVQRSHVERRENKDHLNNGEVYKIGTVEKEKLNGIFSWTITEHSQDKIEELLFADVIVAIKGHNKVTKKPTTLIENCYRIPQLSSQTLQCTIVISQNQLMVWVGRDFWHHLVPIPLPLTPYTWSNCSEAHPAWPSTFPGMGHPQSLWKVILY